VLQPSKPAEDGLAGVQCMFCLKLSDFHDADFETCALAMVQHMANEGGGGLLLCS
jgi:hypothetical protein